METQTTTNESFKAVISNQVQECIDKCLECFKSCSSLIPHCLQLGEEHASAQHIGLLSLCAEVCHTSIKGMQFDLELKDKVCDLCADICIQCAEECEDTADGDQMMLSCASTCRECAEACQRMMQ
jgi:hypothetical protein